MKILLVGGSGHVGTFITPYLKKQHELRVLDMVPPQHEVEYIKGSIDDPAVLKEALDGVDAFITMVMKGGQDGVERTHTIEQAQANYAVNCLGLHLLLLTACEMGISRGVHTSSMSAHQRERRYYPSEEDVPMDGPNVYGLTKRFSEEICRYFAREYDMSLVALRITGPRTREQFLEQYNNPPRRPWGTPLYITDEEDMARAYLASLDYVFKGHGRFDSFFISGDAEHAEVNMSKAKMLLGWEPRAQVELGLEQRKD
jgi:nucleoside-diphosphate-sugar epimerase